MKTATKNIYLLTAISLLSLTAYADTTSAPTLVGNYQCQRTDASGNKNSPLYTLSITPTGGSYTFEWDSSNGYPVLAGTGVMNQSANNLAGVVYSDPKDNNNFGSELFEIKPDGSLKANWVLQASNQVGSETCTRK